MELNKRSHSEGQKPAELVKELRQSQAHQQQNVELVEELGSRQ